MSIFSNPYTRYQNAIAYLATGSVTKPSIEFLQQLCPHLRLAEIEQILKKVRSGKRSYYLAVPPLHIQGGVLVIAINPRWYHRGNKKWCPESVSFAFEKRTRISYADEKLHGDCDYYPRYTERAMRYANEKWGNRLAIDDWHSFITLIMQDPGKLSERGYPKTEIHVHIATRRPWNDIMNDGSAPLSQLINDSIARVTIDPVEASEIKGGRGGYTDFSCSRCGGGLSLTLCTSCGLQYKDDVYRCGWSVPLPRKVIDCLRAAGLNFRIDPALAIAEEKAAWEARHAEWDKKEAWKKYDEAMKLVKAAEAEIKDAQSRMTNADKLKAEVKAGKVEAESQAAINETERTADLTRRLKNERTRLSAVKKARQEAKKSKKSKKPAKAKSANRQAKKVTVSRKPR